MASQAILILGRFTPTRVTNLDAMRDPRRAYDLSLMLFNFYTVVDRDVATTVTLLARLTCIAIAGLTNPVCIPIELRHQTGCCHSQQIHSFD